MTCSSVPRRRSDLASFRWHSHLRFGSARILKIRLANAAPLALAAAFVALAVAPSALRAQNAPAQISAVTPSTGKADDSITITGKNLDKTDVTAVFLSDAKLDHKAVVVDQEAGKIVIKVPDLKPGDYNISIEQSGSIYIQPVIFKVKT